MGQIPRSIERISSWNYVCVILLGICLTYCFRVTVSAVSSLVGPAHGLICCYLCWCDIFEQINLIWFDLIPTHYHVASLHTQGQYWWGTGAADTRPYQLYGMPTCILEKYILLLLLTCSNISLLFFFLSWQDGDVVSSGIMMSLLLISLFSTCLTWSGLYRATGLNKAIVRCILRPAGTGPCMKDSSSLGTRRLLWQDTTNTTQQWVLARTQHCSEEAALVTSCRPVKIWHHQ